MTDPGTTATTTGVTAEHSAPLRPPFRGDVLAGVLLAIAFALLVGSVAVLSDAELIIWRSNVRLLSELNLLSMALTVVAFLWSWAKDWRWLRAEERDITALFTRPELQANPEQLLRSDHGARGPKAVQTLLDDRVNRTVARRNDEAGAPLRESELRAIAVWRSASVGSLARYASGLLLLLTVLGTFLGVKASLDPLQEALAGASTSTASASALAAPLQSVASAFGANLTALLGSMTLGLGAWALSVGRQNMLARLEQVSSLYVYPKVKQRGPEEQLADAAGQIAHAGTGMAAAAQELSGVRTALVGELGEIRTSMVGQLGTLSDSVGDFSASIDDSLKQTRSMLKTLMEQQAAQVADESRRTVDKLERQITDTTIAVQQATTLYGTMVGRLERDMQVASDTTRALAAAVAELREAREGFGRYADSATRTIDERLARLEQASTRQLEVSTQTYERYVEIDRSLTALVTRVGALATSIGEAEQRRQGTIGELEERAARRVAEHLAPTLATLSETVASLNASLRSVPREIGDAVRESVPRGVGGGAGGGAGTAAARDVGPAIERLVGVLEGMEQRRSRSLWQRITRRNGSRGA